VLALLSLGVLTVVVSPHIILAFAACEVRHGQKDGTKVKFTL
jgi:hypothetical protein